VEIVAARQQRPNQLDVARRVAEAVGEV